MNTIILRTSLATAAAIFGIAIGAFYVRSAKAKIDPLIYGAAGILLAVVLLDILPESNRQLSLSQMCFAVISGFLLFAGISRYMYSVCPACGITELHQSQSVYMVPLILTALTVHSFMDGAAIASSTALSAAANQPVLWAIMIHKIPEGIALFGLLVSAAIPVKRALVLSVAVELTTELGGLAGVWMLHHLPEKSIAFVFAHVAGGFLFLCGSTVFPGIRKFSRRQMPKLAYTIGGFAVAAAMLHFMSE